MSNDPQQPELHPNSDNTSNNLVRPDGTFSEDTVMSSLNLAMASAREENDSSRFAGPSRDRTKGMSRLAAIRMEEGGVDGQYDADEGEDGHDSTLFNLENPSTPTAKRGRGRPKGSLDRNPRSIRNSKNNASVGLDNEVYPFASSTGREFDSDDGMNTPSIKRKPGRPRKDRTNLPPTPRATKTLAGLSPSRSAAMKAAASAAVMTPERREANRLAAERSRIRKAEKAVILEKMAKGLTEENVALKDKIKTLTTLGLDATLQEKTAGEKAEGASENWLRTGHAIDAPEIDPTLSKDMSGVMSQTEVVQPSTVTSSTNALPQFSLSTSMADVPEDLKRQLQQRLENQIVNLQALLREDDTSMIQDQLTAPAGEDAQSLRDIAAMTRKETTRAKEAVTALRDELLLLDQTSGQARDREKEGEDLWIVDMDENVQREAAQARHADVEAALVDMKRHLGQLMAHYDLAPPDMNGKRAFTLPEKFELIPLPQPMKRGRPSKPPTRTDEGEPAVKRPRGRPSGEAKLSRNTPSKRAEQFRRYRVEGDPDNIYIEKRSAVPGSADEQVVEVTSRRLYNPRTIGT